jgi:hypothetical protein
MLKMMLHQSPVVTPVKYTDEADAVEASKKLHAMLQASPTEKVQSKWN